MKAILTIILILTCLTVSADVVIFYNKTTGKVLSGVEVKDRVVSKEKCAKNNGLSEENIGIRYYKGKMGKEDLELPDTFTELEAKEIDGKKVNLITQKVRKESLEKETTIDK